MSDSKIKLVGVTVALLLHIIVALVLTQEQIVKWLFPKPKVSEVAKVEDKKKPVLSFTITPSMLKAPEVTKLEKPKVPKPSVAKKRYTTTNDDQAQGKPKNAKFYGSNDTVAQSNAAVDPNAKALPSVAGKKRDSSSMASNFQDGSLKHENRGKPTPQVKPSPPEIPAPPTDSDKALAESEQQSKVVPQMDAGRPLSGSMVPLVEYMESINKLPSSIKSKDPVARVEKLDKGKEKSQDDEKKGKSELAKNQEKAQQQAAKKPAVPITKISKSGFKPKTLASQSIGSISRRGGVSSHDTEATPLGRYKKSVHNSIAKEWYRRVGRNPDLIKPGALVVRWYVYDSGKVRSINILRELQGSEIQKGITIQSIASAKIPKMPAPLRKELDGEPIEMSITFQF